MTPWIESWVTGGALIDGIIALTLLEVAALLAYHRTTKRGPAPRDYLLNVISGLCLMLALRCALAGSAWYFLSALLVAAGCTHVADIVMRFQQRASKP